MSRNYHEENRPRMKRKEDEEELRTTKGEYDDRATLEGRTFVPENY